MPDYYEIRHAVGFKEINLVGHVYYVNYLRCQELFLKEKAPLVLWDPQDDLKLFTLMVDCEFLSEIIAFDELPVRRRLEEHAEVRRQRGREPRAGRVT